MTAPTQASATSVTKPGARGQVRGRGAASGQPPADTETDVSSSRGLLAARISLGRVLASESSNYFLLLGVTLFLLVFGFVMVLSASSVDGFGPDALSQGIYALIGIPVMLIASQIPQVWWRRLAWPALIAACILQVLVVATPLGGGNEQNKNWLTIGGFQFQPSEAIKLGMILWLGMFVTLKWQRLSQWRYMLLPVLIVTGAAIGLVLAGQDLGTVLIMGAIVLGSLFIAGIPLRQLFVVVVLMSAVAYVFVTTNQSRLERVTAFLHPQDSDPNSSGYQTLQGTWALASGGVFGVGLGNSHSKWNWLPEADSDFIFGVIGEELGLIGAIVVLVLFVALAFVFIRIIRSSDDPFVRVTTAAVMVWLVGQALVNIAVVIGLLPPLGVPLPFISHGGTALLSSLFAIGVVLSFTRSPSPWRSRKARLR